MYAIGKSASDPPIKKAGGMVPTSKLTKVTNSVKTPKATTIKKIPYDGKPSSGGRR